eukprot:gene19418-32111_t
MSFDKVRQSVRARVNRGRAGGGTDTAFWAEIAMHELRPLSGGSEEAVAAAARRKTGSRRVRMAPIPSEQRAAIWKAATLGIGTNTRAASIQYKQAGEECEAHDFPSKGPAAFCGDISMISAGLHSIGPQPPPGISLDGTGGGGGGGGGGSGGAGPAVAGGGGAMTMQDPRLYRVLQRMAWIHTSSGVPLPLWPTSSLRALSSTTTTATTTTTTTTNGNGNGNGNGKVDTFAIAIALAPVAGPFSPSGQGDAIATPLVHTRVASWLMLQTFERLANKRLPTESAAVLEHFAAAAVGKASIKGKKAAAAAAASLPTAVARPFAGFVTHWAFDFRFKSAKLTKYHDEGYADARAAMGATGVALGVHEQGAGGGDAAVAAAAAAAATEPKKVSHVPLFLGAEDSAGALSTSVSKLGTQTMQQLWAAFPARYQHCDAHLLFATARDGYNL